MSDTNRLEFDIVAIDDSTQPVSSKARSNFQSIEQQAAKSAAGMSRSFDAASVSLSRSVERASAGLAGSLQRLEQKAALAGKTGIEATIAKLRQQESILLARAGDDEAVRARITAAINKQVEAQLRLNAARSVKFEGTQAGQAVLSGEAEFQAALKRSQAGDAAIANLQRQRTLAAETPAQRQRREESEFLSQYGTTPQKRSTIADEFAAQRKNATGALRASLLQEEEALKAAELANANIFRRMAAHAKEWAAAVVTSSKEVSARLVETAEASGIAGGASAARGGGGGGLFGGFGTLIGVGIGAGFIAHEVDEMARANVELDHLATTTGIAARQLAGLQQIVREHGGDWDAFSLGLTRMEVALGKAREGSEKQIAAFEHLGVSEEQLKTLTPEQVFYKMAAGIENVKDHALLAESASVVFSRGWRLVVPVMKEVGASMEETTNKSAALSGVTRETIADSYKLIEAHAKLSQILRFLGNTAITVLVPSLQYLLVGFDALGATVLAVFDVLVAGAISAVKAIRDVGTVLYDVATGQFSKADVDAKKVATNFANIWKGAGNDIGSHFAGVGKDRAAFFAKAPVLPGEKDIPGAYGDDEDTGKARKNKPSYGDGAFGREILDAQREYNSAQLELARKQREATFKAYDDEQKRKLDAEQSLVKEIDRLDTEQRSRYFQRETSDNEREKNLALSQLGLIDAQSVKEKIALEDQKLAIETAYAERSLQIQIEKIRSDAGKQYDELLKQRNIAGPNGEAAYEEAKGKVDYAVGVDIDEARKATAEKELIQAQDIANKKTQLAISENRKIFDNLKQAAGGLFDALFEKSKSFADVLKGLFKTAILTPIKDIFSSQVAGLFTELITGQKVTFNEVGSGQGRFGRLGSILGRAGLGTPRFGQPGDHLSNLNLPNHLGDAQLVSGAVPVMIINGGSQSLAVEAAGGGVQGLARSLVALPQILGSVSSGTKALSAAAGVAPVALKRLQESVGSAISYSNGAVDALSSGNDQFVSDYLAGQLPTPPPYQTAERVGYDSLDNYDNRDLGSGGSGFAPDPGGGFLDGIRKFILNKPDTEHGGYIPSGGSASGGGSSSGGGIGGILGGGGGLFGKGGLAGFFGKAPGTPGLPDTSGPVPGQTLPGAPPIGGLAGLQGSAAASLGAAIGFGLVLDGLKRKSGVASAIETPLGAAAIGFKLGGTGGAFVGAGAGLLADGLKRGGVTGIFEDAGGGALIGAKFGGPVGAVIGAAIGAGAGLIRKFFFETDREHTKKLVKQIYGIKINDSTADAIIQIAKQKYGGAISIAVRSQEVRDLLKLYAETLGDKKGQAQFVNDKIHSASLIESGGKLYQQAIYDNGSAYAYSSPLSTYGGVNTSPLPTSARDSGGPNIGSLQLVVNGQSASDLLAGQVANTATPGFIQGRVLSASSSSNGRLNQTALTVSPNAITR